MSNNQLMIFQSDAELKYRFFTKDREEKTEEITNEQLAAAERQKTDQEVNDFHFGGMGGNLDDLVNLYSDMISTIHEETKEEVIKIDELKVETADPYQMKRYEEEKTIFARRRAEAKVEKDPLTNNVRAADQSTSTNFVKNDQAWGPNYGNRSGYGNNTGYGTNTGFGTAPTNNAVPKPGEKISFDAQIPKAAQSAMDVAWRSPPIVEVKKDEGWGKKSLFRRAKEWFKSKAGRTTVKTGILIAMQLTMAYIGKRYEYEGIGKMMTHVGLLLGTWYVTKELQKDGMDPRGFAI